MLAKVGKNQEMGQLIGTDKQSQIYVILVKPQSNKHLYALGNSATTVFYILTLFVKVIFTRYNLHSLKVILCLFFKENNGWSGIGRINTEIKKMKPNMDEEIQTASFCDICENKRPNCSKMIYEKSWKREPC